MKDATQDAAPDVAGEPTNAVQRLIELAGGVSAAARIAGVARNTADQWFKGRSRIPFSAVVQLADKAGVGIDGLLGRTQLPNMIQVQAGGRAQDLPEGFVTVPMLDVQVSAGNGLMAIDEHRYDLVSFREEWLRSLGLKPGRVEALMVAGDSMDPTIRDGDMILVDRQIDRIVDGGIYVLVIGGEVRVKRILVRTDGSLVLKSDNAIYGEERVPEDKTSGLAIAGRVRWFGRMI